MVAKALVKSTSNWVMVSRPLCTADRLLIMSMNTFSAPAVCVSALPF